MSSYLLICVGLIMLVFGGDILVRGASAIAKKLNLSPLVIGMTVVAFGTSAPELMVSVKAALMGSPEIALGNVIGSNIANVSLVLGITVLIYPLAIDRNSKIIDWPMMLFSSILFYLFALDYSISLLEGIIFFAILVAFTAFIIVNSRRKNKSYEPDLQEVIPNFWIANAKILIGLVLLYFGSEWLVSGAVEIAKSFGVEERIIGVTVIAVGTSIPELAASVIAAIKKEADISIGNLVGSNIFNITSVIGITAMIKPIEVTAKTINPDMYWMIGVALGLGLILFFWKTINRWHGISLVLAYSIYIAILAMSM